MTTLVQLLTESTQVRLQLWTGSMIAPNGRRSRGVCLVEPPTPSDPKTYVHVAQKLVGSDDPIVSAGQVRDHWRLSLLLVAVDHQIDPQAIADICIALGDTPSVDEAAQAKLAVLKPDARVIVDAVLAELASMEKVTP